MRSPPRARPEGRRAALAVAIALFHGLALILLLTAPPPPHRDAVLERVVTLVAHTAPPAKPAPPPTPPPPLHSDVEVMIAAPTVTIAADLASPSFSASSSPGEGCAIERGIAEALADNPSTRAALAAIGPARAETGAIALWNGIWVVPPDPADAARLAALRPTVRAAVAAAAPECAAAEQVGPRLTAIAGQARPMLLVIGSGHWRWRDLLRGAPAPG